MPANFVILLCYGANKRKHNQVQAEETENLVSDLARTIGGERALIEECKDSLFKVYASEVCLNIYYVPHFSASCSNFCMILWRGHDC
jgi:hypothetical protein